MPRRFNLRRTVLDILAPVLLTLSIWMLVRASDYVQPYAPVTSKLLMLLVAVEAALGLWAVYHVGDSNE